MYEVVNVMYGHAFSDSEWHRLLDHLSAHPDTQSELGDIKTPWDFRDAMEGRLLPHWSEDGESPYILMGVRITYWPCFDLRKFDSPALVPDPQKIEIYRKSMAEIRSLKCLRDFDFGEPLVYFYGTTA